MGIRIENVSKRFGSFHVLKDVSLHVKTGELVAMLGPSGSGKTTLLRIVAGLEFPDFGTITLDRAKSVPDKARRVGFVFQHYALFRHMSVFENIAFGLRVMDRKVRPPESAIRAKVMELLDLVHLSGLHDRYPPQLSGGQRQRVALARALAIDPEILLLDEPFGALDAKVRKDLRRWLRRLHDDLGITTVFVTHDQEEAMDLADRVVVMSAGQIEQTGKPEEVWLHPANAFVYDFLGNYNAFEGWEMPDGALLIAEDAARQAPSQDALPVQLFTRPHDMEILEQRPQTTENALPARIVHINPAGPLVTIELESGFSGRGRALEAAMPREKYASLTLHRGQTIWLVARKLTSVPERKNEQQEETAS